jgi:hypothetical protein
MTSLRGLSLPPSTLGGIRLGICENALKKLVAHPMALFESLAALIAVPRGTNLKGS